MDLSIEAIDQELRRRLDRYVPESSRLKEAMEYSLLAPGKRIRPQLTLVAAKAMDLPFEAGLSVGLALETFHCFTLIHDDLPCMDDDDFRRGKPSNHKVYGEAIALLAGDSLMTLSLEILGECLAHVPQAPFQKGLTSYLQAVGAGGVMGGQASELLLAQSPSEEELLKIYDGKTGALFRACFLVPAAMAELPQPQAWETFAHAFGRAFQVADDLDDWEQDQGQNIHKNLRHFRSAEELAESTRRSVIDAMQGLPSSATEGLRPWVDSLLRNINN